MPTLATPPEIHYLCHHDRKLSMSMSNGQPKAQPRACLAGNPEHVPQATQSMSRGPRLRLGIALGTTRITTLCITLNISNQ